MKQVRRDDPVGDLARDVDFDINADLPMESNRKRDWEEYLYNNGACEGAKQALIIAFNEFRRSRGYKDRQFKGNHTDRMI